MFVDGMYVLGGIAGKHDLYSPRGILSLPIIETLSPISR